MSYSPEVGKCEILTMPSSPDIEVWKPCEISFVGSNIVVYTCEAGERAAYKDKVEFRPIKTEEEKQIDDACKAVMETPKYSIYNNHINSSAAIKFTIEALIKAGYRNQPKVKVTLGNLSWLCDKNEITVNDRMEDKGDD